MKKQIMNREQTRQYLLTQKKHPSVFIHCKNGKFTASQNPTGIYLPCEQERNMIFITDFQGGFPNLPPRFTTKFEEYEIVHQKTGCPTCVLFYHNTNTYVIPFNLPDTWNKAIERSSRRLKIDIERKETKKTRSVIGKRVRAILEVEIKNFDRKTARSVWTLSNYLEMIREIRSRRERVPISMESYLNKAKQRFKAQEKADHKHERIANAVSEYLYPGCVTGDKIIESMKYEDFNLKEKGICGRCVSRFAKDLLNELRILAYHFNIKDKTGILQEIERIRRNTRDIKKKRNENNRDNLDKVDIKFELNGTDPKKLNEDFKTIIYNLDIKRPSETELRYMQGSTGIPLNFNTDNNTCYEFNRKKKIYKPKKYCEKFTECDFKKVQYLWHIRHRMNENIDLFYEFVQYMLSDKTALDWTRTVIAGYATYKIHCEFKKTKKKEPKISMIALHPEIDLTWKMNTYFKKVLDRVVWARVFSVLVVPLMLHIFKIRQCPLLLVHIISERDYKRREEIISMSDLKKGIFIIITQYSYKVVIHGYKTDMGESINHYGDQLNFDPNDPIKNTWKYLRRVIKDMFLAYEYLLGYEVKHDTQEKRWYVTEKKDSNGSRLVQYSAFPLIRNLDKPHESQQYLTPDVPIPDNVDRVYIDRDPEDFLYEGGKGDKRDHRKKIKIIKKQTVNLKCDDKIIKCHLVPLKMVNDYRKQTYAIFEPIKPQTSKINKSMELFWKMIHGAIKW